MLTVDSSVYWLWRSFPSTMFFRGVCTSFWNGRVQRVVGFALTSNSFFWFTCCLNHASAALRRTTKITAQRNLISLGKLHCCIKVHSVGFRSSCSRVVLITPPPPLEGRRRPQSSTQYNRLCFYFTVPSTYILSVQGSCHLAFSAVPITPGRVTVTIVQNNVFTHCDLLCPWPFTTLADFDRSWLHQHSNVTGDLSRFKESERSM